MHAFLLDQLVATDYTALEPGAFFVYETVPDDQALAVVLRHDDPKVLRVLTLNGEDAFKVRDFDRKYTHSVLPIKVDSGRIRLRIDSDAGALATAQPQPGRLILGDGGAPMVEVTHVPERGMPATAAVWLRDWTLSHLRNPRFEFAQWALSYLDDAGQWVDLVRRE